MLYFKFFLQIFVISLFLFNSTTLLSINPFGRTRPRLSEQRATAAIPTPQPTPTLVTPTVPVPVNTPAPTSAPTTTHPANGPVVTTSPTVNVTDIARQLPNGNSGIILINNNPQSNSFIQDIKLFNSQIWTLDFYKGLLNRSKGKAVELSRLIYQRLEPYKKHIAIGCILASYAAIQSYLLYLKNKLVANNNWSKWQGTKSLDQLYTIGQNQFSKQLLTDIQSIYTCIEKPQDFVTPLTNFMKDIELETKQLLSYKKTINFLKIAHVNKLFIYDSNLYENTDLRLQRLSYIKNTFLSWLSEYKLNNSEKIVYRNILDRCANDS